MGGYMLLLAIQDAQLFTSPIMHISLSRYDRKKVSKILWPLIAHHCGEERWIISDVKETAES